MHFKHDNKEDEKKNSSYCIVSLRSTLLVQCMCDKKRKKDVFSKSEHLSRQIIRRQKKNINKQKPCLCGPQKKKYNYDMEAERKKWTKKIPLYK